MAKTVKFNLICDNQPVRTIEDLQNHFSVEDVLEYYNNKLLHKWLTVRGYDAYLQAVNKIKKTDPLEIIQALISVFGIEADSNRIRESIYMLEYRNERNKINEKCLQKDADVRSITDEYNSGYFRLVERIVEYADDIAVIRVAVSELIERYYWLIVVDRTNLFYKLYDKAPLAIFVMLTHEELRPLYLPQIVRTPSQTADDTNPASTKAVDSDDTGARTKQGQYSLFGRSLQERGKAMIEESAPAQTAPAQTASAKGNSGVNKEEEIDIYKTYDDPELNHAMEEKKAMFNKIQDLNRHAGDFLGDQLLEFSGVTEGYWKDLEPKGKRYMILSMDKSDFVRSAGKTGEEYRFENIVNKFLILDGIDYKSNYASHVLRYMEV